MTSDKCPCCATTLPVGVKTCPNCLMHVGEPAPKYEPGTWIKYSVNDQYTYNVVVDSYYNDSDGLHMHMYRLHEHMAMPVYREDWLEPVSDEEKQMLIDAQNAGKLGYHRRGGWYIIQDEEAVANG